MSYKFSYCKDATNGEKEKLFYERMSKELNFNLLDYSINQELNGDDNRRMFNKIYDSNKTFIYAFGTLKINPSEDGYDLKDETFRIILKDNITVAQFKKICDDVNKRAKEICEEVLGDTGYMTFHYPYWHYGIYYSAVEKNKQKEVEQARIAYEESEIGKYEKEHGHNPCEYCTTFNNCKHCKYGDDGRYSIYDVYSINELI